jgi:hypothetical protein
MVSPAIDMQTRVISVTQKTGGKTTAENTPGFGVLAGVAFNRSIVRWILREVNVANGWDVFSAPDPYAAIPQGLIVGKVKDISIDGFFYTLTIAPAMDFYSLSNVLILVPKNK